MGDLAVGTEVAGLRIDAVAGRGGMGVVYRAFDPNLQRVVALKVIADEYAADPEFHDRFRQEARSAAAIVHPGVVTVYQTGVDDGRLFLVTEYVEGTDLRALISERGRIGPGPAVELISQVAAALDTAHGNGLVHRDVKPANILVARFDGEPRAYLTDFGLARPLEVSRHITGTGLVIGTEAYMAPELFTGAPASVRSDVYALGCVLFHAVAGRVFPRGGGGDPGLAGDVADPGLAAGLDAVVRRALAVQPGDRFASAGALAAAARAALAAAPGATRRPPGSAPVDERHRPTRDPGVAAPRPSGTTRGPGRAPHESTVSARVAAPAEGPAPVTVPPQPAGPVYRAVPVARAPEPASAPCARPVPPPAGRPQPSGPSVPSAPVVPVVPVVPPVRRSRTPVVVAVATAAVVAAGVAALLVLPGSDDGGPGSPPPVALGPVLDDGDELRLTWTGPGGLDYGVEVAEPGQAGRTQLVGRTTTAVVPVVPGRGYCVQVRGTDGASVRTSPLTPVRGASC